MKNVLCKFPVVLIASLIFLPAMAEAGWRGGDMTPGLGKSVLTDQGPALQLYAAAASDPANTPPVPPPANEPPAPQNAPLPPPGQPGPDGTVSAPPHPGPEAKCREWKMVERRMENRWDSYNNRWHQIPVEKWDWVDVPCGRPETASVPPPSLPPASVPPPPEGNIAPPPPVEFSAPPSVAVIPGTYAYVVPGVDIVFYHGFWYRPWGGRWFWSRSYGGPWVYLPPPRVPSALLTLPPGYYRVPPGYPRIPYARFHTNWGRWERERYWHGQREWREGWRHR